MSEFCEVRDWHFGQKRTLHQHIVALEGEFGLLEGLKLGFLWPPLCKNQTWFFFFTI